MQQTGSIKAIGAAGLVALSIIAMKTALPIMPLSTTVLAAIFGLALIASFYWSDIRRRRKAALAAAETADLPMDSTTIRGRLEGRPLPQVRPGPLSRGWEPAPAKSLAAPETPTLELVRGEEPVFELTEQFALSPVAR